MGDYSSKKTDLIRKSEILFTVFNKKEKKRTNNLQYFLNKEIIQ